MFKDSVLDKFYGNKKISEMPVNTAAETVKVIEEILYSFTEEDYYATFSDLFDE